MKRGFWGECLEYIIMYFVSTLKSWFNESQFNKIPRPRFCKQMPVPLKILYCSKFNLIYWLTQFIEQKWYDRLVRWIKTWVYYLHINENMVSFWIYSQTFDFVYIGWNKSIKRMSYKRKHKISFGMKIIIDINGSWHIKCKMFQNIIMKIIIFLAWFFLVISLTFFRH